MLPDVLPTLPGPAVTLRPFRHGDEDAVASAASDALIPLITTVPADGDAQALSEFIDRQNRRLAEGLGYSFAIAETATDRAVGQIGLWTSQVPTSGRASIGYWIVPDARRRGYGTAALRTLVAWVSGIAEVERLELYVEPWNEGSWRVAEASGFVREGLLHSWQRVGDERRDMYLYALVQVRGRWDAGGDARVGGRTPM